MPIVKNRIFIIVSVSIILFLLAFQNISAQQDTSKTYEGISLSEISIQASQVTLQLIQSNDFLLQQTRMEEINNSIPQLLEDIEKEKKNSALKNLNLLRGNDLILIEKVWKEFYQKLLQWQNEIRIRVDNLNSEADELNEIIVQWRLTYKSAVKENAPNAIRSSINEVVSESKKMRRKYIKRINDLLVFQNRIANNIYTVTAKLLLIGENKDSFLTRTFNEKDIPLWEIWAGKQDSSIADLEKLKELSYDFKANLNYLTNIDFVSFQLFLWILFAIIIYAVKKKSETWKISAENANLKIAKNLTQRPIPTSFILSFFSIILFSTKLPYGFAEFNIIILTIPVFFLLKVFVRKPLIKYFVILFVLYIVNTLSEYLFIEPILERHYSLVLDLIAIITLILLLKNQNQFRAHGFKSSKIFRGISIIGILFFTTAILGTFSGRYEFAKLLSNGMITGIYYAIILRILTYLIDGIVAYFFRDKERHLFRSIKKNAKPIEKRIISIVHLYFLWVWFRSFLNAFTIYEPLKENVIGFITNQFPIGNISISISEILLFFFIIIASWYFSKIIRAFLELDVFSRFKFPRGVPGAISMVIKYIMVTFGFILAVASAGIDISTLGVVAGGLGVGIGFGLQNVVFNFVSGLILTFERPIQTGDTVEVGKLLGNVTEIGVRSSKVRTFEGSEVIVPNGNLISNEVINWSLSDRNKRHNLPFITAFGSDPNIVVATILEVVRNNKKVIQHPEPMALFEGLDEHGLIFKVLFWVNLDESLSAKSEVAIGIHDALKNVGIQLPIPRRDINMKNIDE